LPDFTSSQISVTKMQPERGGGLKINWGGGGKRKKRGEAGIVVRVGNNTLTFEWTQKRRKNG